jgi:osmoprotectant transport system substrate-binding protein
MRLSRRLTLGALLLAVVSACNAGGGSTPAPATSATLPTIKIGSVGFDEARVMAEIYAQALEAHGYTIDRTGIGLGDRSVVAPAIQSGQIQLQPEYIGSRISYELKQANPSGGPTIGGITGPTGDSATNLANLQTLLAPQNLTVLKYTPAVDTNAFVVRADTAQSLNLTKMSDLAAVQGQLKFGLATDCPTNPLCGAPGGALSKYGITPDTIAGATLLSACDTPMAQALLAKTIDVGELCSTQPDIIVNGWTILADDLKTQPADNISPIVRNDLLATVDQASFEKILNDVSAKIDTPTLADLYKQVTIDHKDPKDVAAAWLKANGFVS